jgi:cytochrome c-type biogenesis protein CcmH
MIRRKAAAGLLYLVSCRLPLVLLLGLLLPTLLGGQVVAQAQVTDEQVRAVARELWCPLCSNVRLDTCDLQACEQMRQEIALKLAAGEDLESIKAYFLEQYGPQILGEPPREGFNWLAWILPFVVLLGSGLFLVLRGRRLFSARKTAALDSSQAVRVPGDDPYARQLEEELKRYE